MTVTQPIYQVFDDAFRFFNEELFNSTLSPVAITFQRSRTAYGYFRAAAFKSRSGKFASEIALNPDAFLEQNDKEIFSTLVHEMVHHWQHEVGQSSRHGYHNRKFAQKMQSVGLIASATGEPGGKQTGQNMSHYIEDGGLFDIKCTAYIDRELINWGSISAQIQTAQDVGILVHAENARITQDTSKTNFRCPICNQNAWAKQSALLICGKCQQPMKMLLL